MRKLFFIFAIILFAGSYCEPAFSQVGVAPNLDDLRVYQTRGARARSLNQSASRSAVSANRSATAQRNTNGDSNQGAQTRSSNRATRGSRSAVSNQPINVSVPSSTVSARSAVSQSQQATRQSQIPSGRSARSATLRATQQQSAQPMQSGQQATTANRATRRSARSGVSSAPVQQSSGSARSAMVSSGQDYSSGRSATPITRSLGGRSAQSYTGTNTAGEARVYEQDFIPLTQTEEQTFVDVKECKAQYEACMNEYCDDGMADDESIIGKCLCSETYQNYTQRNYELETMIRRINQMIDSVAGLELKAKSGQVGGAVYETITEDIANTLGFNFLDTNNLSDEIDYGDYSNARRKEGGALYNKAHNVCKRFLDMCPQTGMNGEYMTNQYYAQIERSCRVYDRELDTRKKEYTLKIQKLYNQYQTKEKQIALESNKYDEGQCGTKLYNCMLDFCDKDFSKCNTTTALDNNKVYCSSILANCKNISESVWNKFKASILTQLGK